MKFSIPTEVGVISKKFEEAGYEIYIVGGAVRDMVMGKPVMDWDFTTNATPDEILKVIPNGYYNNQFGTVGLESEEGLKPFEITTYRTERDYKDARRPSIVAWGKNLTEDLQRRDFTINAMALGPDLKIIDPYEGLKDIDSKTIRAVGDPNERFGEDALRMMRAVRIASELGFTIEHKTHDAIKLNAPSINKIARERVRDELIKIMASPNPYEGMVMFRETGLLGEVIPEMEKAFGVDQKSPQRHHIYDVGTHSLFSLKYCKSTDPITRFATFIHDIGKPVTYKKLENGVVTFYNHEVIGTTIAGRIAQRLRFSRAQTQKLLILVRWHQFTVDEHQTDTAIRRFITHVGKENIDDMLALRVGDRLGSGAKETSWRLEDFKKRITDVQKQPFSIRDLKINGNDIMKELNLKPSPKVGEILESLFEEVAEKKTENNKEELLKRAKEIV